MYDPLNLKTNELPLVTCSWVMSSISGNHQYEFTAA